MKTSVAQFIRSHKSGLYATFESVEGLLELGFDPMTVALTANTVLELIAKEVEQTSYELRAEIAEESEDV